MMQTTNFRNYNLSFKERILLLDLSPEKHIIPILPLLLEPPGLPAYHIPLEYS